MASLRTFFFYLFWPNPGNAYYTSPKIQVVLAVCIFLLLFSFIFGLFRRRMRNPILKKLSRSWSSAAFWFGILGLLFAVSRVEGIGFLAMRAWWVGWGIAVAFFAGVQLRLFKARYYETLPKEDFVDPRDRYLPKKKN